MRGSCLVVLTWLSAALLTRPALAGGNSACDNHACFSGVKQWCQGVCPFDPLNFGSLCATTCAAAAGNASSCLNSSNDTTGQALLDTLDVLAPTCAVLGGYTQTTLTPCKDNTVDDSPCAAVEDGAPCSSGCRDALNMINSNCRGYLATLIYYVAIPSHVSLGVLQTCGVGPFPNLNGGHPIPSMLPWITSDSDAPSSNPALSPALTPGPGKATIEGGGQSPAPAPTDTFSSSMSDKKSTRVSSSLSAGVIAAIVIAAMMCALVLVLLALFLVQRHRQGTNTPSLIPGLGASSKARQGKGGPAGGSSRGRNLKALTRTPRTDSFGLDANPSGFAHLMRDSESHSTASPQSQSELPVTGSGLSAQTSAFGVKGGGAGGSAGAPHIWSNASTQDWFLGANPAAGALDAQGEKPWFSEVARLSPFPPPESLLEASQMEMYRHGVPGLGNQNSAALGHAVGIDRSRQLEGAPIEGDDGMNWDLQPEQVQPCRTADGRPVILGTGAYGNVYKGILNGVTEVAIKVLHNDMDLPRFRQEISILKRCRDNNIVNYLGAFRQAGRTMLVTEFMGQGNLFKALQTHRQDATLCWRNRGHDIALNVARGLVYMHGCSPRVIHFDLKSPNILLNADGTAKIADVGLSRVLSQTHLSNPRFVGTFAWAAPELLTGTRCSELVDVYSLGVVMWELITGEQPERGCLRAPRVPEECPKPVEELMDQCLLPTPELRPSALQVYERLLALQQELNSPAPTSDASPGFPITQNPLSDAGSVTFSAHHLSGPQMGQAQTVQASPFQQQQGTLQNQRGPSSLQSPFAPQELSSPTSDASSTPSSFSATSPPAPSYQRPQRLAAGYASKLASPFQQAMGGSIAASPSRQQSTAVAGPSPFAEQTQQQLLRRQFAAASPSPFAEQSQQQLRMQPLASMLSPLAANDMQHASPPLSAIPESAGGCSSTGDPASRTSSAAESPELSFNSARQQQQQNAMQQLPAGRWPNAGYPTPSPSRLHLGQGVISGAAPDAMSHRKTMSM